MNDKNGVQRSRLIQFLLSPSSYPHSPSRVKYIQTHASDVFIIAPYVYKIKKPVDFGFLDYSTLEKRKFFCEREIELNRKLCCNTYLSVEKISKKDGAFKLGAGDETIEYAVKMNLLPEEFFLHTLLKKDLVHKADFSRIARKLADYYSNQVPRGDISKYGQPEDIKSVIYQNLALTEKFIGDTITSQAYEVIKSYSDNFLCNRSNLFRDRMENGWIKDCHGDLRLEHINLADENICIYDCIEFNNNFRYIDIASDVAFLAMDLDYNGYDTFSSFFIDEISRMMKDDNLHSVLDFYKCYRA